MFQHEAYEQKARRTRREKNERARVRRADRREARKHAHATREAAERSAPLVRLGRAGFCDGEHKAHAIRASIRDGLTRAFGHCRVLSIDAWRDGEGWTWNSWHGAGWFPAALLDLPARALLREARARGFLSAFSAGRVAVDDDGHNLVLIDRSTREPLFAIEYGSLYQ